MKQREIRWSDAVRPVPWGWMGKALLVCIVVALVLSDVLHADVDPTDPRGWFELILPYMPLLALLVGVVSGAAAWIVVFAVILSLGVPPMLLSASTVPMIITIALGTFALPKVAAVIFSALVLALISVLGLINPETSGGVLIFSLLAVCAIGAGFGANVMYSRSERYAEQVLELREEQARIRNNERTRLAHELHDIVAHDVTVIAMQARRAEFVTRDPEKTAEILGEIEDSASQALQDLRSLVVLLKTTGTEDPAEIETDAPRLLEATALDDSELSGETTTPIGLIHDIRHVVDAVERGGFRTQLDVEGDVGLVPASVRQALRRTVRELGTNILKHGDRAGDVRLQLIVDDGQVTLCSVNKISAEKPISSSKTGLEAMRARCEVFDGNVETTAEDGMWTTTMTIPIGRQSVAETAQGALT